MIKCAKGDGNPVYIVGSTTGKDGIHGATFASADITEDSANDIPSVQVRRSIPGKTTTGSYSGSH